MRKNVKSYFSDLPKRLLDEKENKKILSVAMYSVLTTVALFMTVLNIFTHKGALTWYTGVFAVLCILDLVLSLLNEKGVVVASVLFSFEAIVLFSFFLVSGNPEGFSAIWICMLPSAGMLFYGRKKGTVLNGIMLVILIAFLWTPLSKYLGWEYTSSFKMRFPLLFFAFYLLAYFLEILRAFAVNELDKMNKLYKEISVRDQLTQLYNRSGMYNAIEEKNKKQTFRRIGVAILDIDDFKKINDTYGHSMGDEVLKDFADILREKINAIVCRWGGEEFGIVYYDDEIRSTDFENLRKTVEESEFIYDNVTVKFTVSGGVYETMGRDFRKFNDWMKKADDALYRAKESGKNKIVYF